MINFRQLFCKHDQRKRPDDSRNWECVKCGHRIFEDKE